MYSLLRNAGTSGTGFGGPPVVLVRARESAIPRWTGDEALDAVPNLLVIVVVCYTPRPSAALGQLIWRLAALNKPLDFLSKKTMYRPYVYA